MPGRHGFLIFVSHRTGRVYTLNRKKIHGQFRLCVKSCAIKSRLTAWRRAAKGCNLSRFLKMRSLSTGQERAKSNLYESKLY